VSDPLRTIGCMEASSLRFATAARVLGNAARPHGWRVPAFRSPPRLAHVERTLRRSPVGEVTVAIKLRDRPWLAVLGDMIEGVVAANELRDGDADRCRTTLWRAVEACDGLVPTVPVTVGTRPGWRNRQTQAA
jgi:hypothetical protein